MDGAATLRSVRTAARLSLRQLSGLAGTSHSTLAAYEAGRKVPSVRTLTRICRAAGFDLTVDLIPAVGGPDPAARGRELAEVLALAEHFPARHAPTLAAPIFGRS